MPRRAQYAFIGAGNNGAVIQARPGVVYKYTRDPVEVASWLAILTQQRNGPLPGLPYVYDVHVAGRAAVITREDVRPLGKNHGLDSYSLGALQTASRLDTKAQVFGHRASALQATRIRSRGLYGPLRPVAKGLKALTRYKLVPGDLRPDNFGLTARGLVLHDPGRSPVETTLARAKGTYNTCPNSKKITSAVRDVLGKAPSYKTCRIVSHTALKRVMKRHGWRDAEINDTAGFHAQDSSIYLLRGNEWSQLHEMVHAAGIIDKDLAPWVTEGITEAVAQDIAKKKKWKHQETYPEYVRVVRKELAPALGLTPLQIGEIVASHPQRAGHELARRLAIRSNLPDKTWYKAIGPGSLSPRAFRSAIQRAA